jgi:hypothetical protein
MIRDSAIGWLKEEENGQHNSPMVRGIQPWQWASWSK